MHKSCGQFFDPLSLYGHFTKISILMVNSHMVYVWPCIWFMGFFFYCNKIFEAILFLQQRKQPFQNSWSQTYFFLQFESRFSAASEWGSHNSRRQENILQKWKYAIGHGLWCSKHLTTFQKSMFIPNPWT